MFYSLSAVGSSLFVVWCSAPSVRKVVLTMVLNVLYAGFSFVCLSARVENSKRHWLLAHGHSKGLYF